MDEEVTTLTELGLTTVQAKTYLALARSDPLNVTETANTSKVPRTDLYRVLRELEKKGIVERILTHPARFKAIPLDECLDNLIQQRTKKTLLLHKKIAKLRKDPKYKTVNHHTNTDSSTFILVPSSRIAEKIGNAIDSAKKSIDLAVSWNRFSHGIFLYTEKLQRAKQRNVECRFVVDLSYEDESKIEQISFTKMNDTFKIKFVFEPLHTVTGIYDMKDIFIIENPTAQLKQSSALWSNNSSLISLGKEYFERLWLTAKENLTSVTTK